MSLKNELLIYSAALEAFDTSNLSIALSHFAKISETSKIQWNMGIILATMGRHNEAIARFGVSIVMDQYLVVGWFQRGVSYSVSPSSIELRSDGRWSGCILWRKRISEWLSSI
jgi:neutrophil factor 2